MLYDLNIPWSSNSPADLQRTIFFLSELNYSVLAVNNNISGPIPLSISNPIPTTFPFTLPKKTTILRRCTFSFADPALNSRLAALAAAYDIVALRPTTEKAFLAACTSISEHSIISLDLNIRYPFYFLPRHLMAAVKRGIKIEICYAQAVQKDGMARRNFIANVLAIVRATGGRGLVVSSEAKTVLGVRGPADVANLMSVWGVGPERAKEAVTVAPRSVVVNEGIKRRGFRGVVDIVNGGDRLTEPKELNEKANGSAKSEKFTGIVNGKASDGETKGKRKNEDEDDKGSTPQMSKRQAKRMRLEAIKARAAISSDTSANEANPVKAATDGEDDIDVVMENSKEGLSKSKS